MSLQYGTGQDSTILKYSLAAQSFGHPTINKPYTGKRKRRLYHIFGNIAAIKVQNAVLARLSRDPFMEACTNRQYSETLCRSRTGYLFNVVCRNIDGRAKIESIQSYFLSNRFREFDLFCTERPFSICNSSTRNFTNGILSQDAKDEWSTPTSIVVALPGPVNFAPSLKGRLRFAKFGKRYVLTGESNSSCSSLGIVWGCDWTISGDVSSHSTRISWHIGLPRGEISTHGRFSVD
jgi:hypothetical protein